MVLGACSFWNSFEPLSILNYSPSEAEIPQESSVAIWVNFNANPDHAKAESAFSLTSDGIVADGIFAWSGPTLNFSPNTPLLVGPLYTLTVTSGAETSDGNSLLNELHHQFRLGPSPGRPTVALDPPDNTTTTNARQPLVLTFSQPMIQDSVLSSLSVSPSLSFTALWSANSTVLTLLPQANWPTGVDLVVALNASTLSNQKNQAAAKNFSSHFMYQPASSTPPQLVHVSQDDLRPAIEFSPPPDSSLAPETFQSGWPINSDLVLFFSQPVVISSLTPLLVVPAHLSYTITPNNTFASQVVRLKFFAPVPWNETLGFSIREGFQDINGLASTRPYHFWIRTDDVRYCPPSVISASWRSTSEQPFQTLKPYQNQAFMTGQGTLRLVVAQGTESSFSLGSFLQQFSITGLGGFSFVIQSVEVNIDPASSTTQKLFNVDVTITVAVPSPPANPQIVTLRLAKSYQDNLCNTMVADYVLDFFATL